MTSTSLDVFSSVFDAMEKETPPRRARKAGHDPAVRPEDAQLLLAIQVSGPNSMEWLSKVTGLPLSQVLESLSSLSAQGYITVSERNGASIFTLTEAGKSLKLGEI